MLIRLGLSVLVALLAACGGGDGGSAGGSVVTPPPTSPQPFSSIAGRYASDKPGAPGAFTIGSIVLHPDGTANLSIQEQQVPCCTAHGALFGGKITPAGAGYVVSGAFSVRTPETNESPATVAWGTATAVLTPVQPAGRPAMAVKISSSVPHTPAQEFTAFFLPWKHSDVPYADFVGRYSRGYVYAGFYGYPGYTGGPSEDSDLPPADLTVAPDGTISGTVPPGCEVSGRLTGFDQYQQMFIVDLTLAGAACPVTGTGRLMGSVSWSVVFQKPTFGASGLIGSRLVSISLVHS